MLQLAQIADREGVNALACQLHKRYVAWRPDLYTDVQELYSEADFLDAIKHRTLYLIIILTVPVIQQSLKELPTSINMFCEM